MVFVIKWYKNDLPGVLVTLIPGIMRGRAMAFILFHILNPKKDREKSQVVILLLLQFSPVQAES